MGNVKNFVGSRKGEPCSDIDVYTVYTHSALLPPQSTWKPLKTQKGKHDTPKWTLSFEAKDNDMANHLFHRENAGKTNP